MEIIKNYVKNVKYVCATADVWTAPDRRIIVTAHWVNIPELVLKLKLVSIISDAIVFYSFVRKP